MNDENKNSVILDNSIDFPLTMDEYYYRYRISSVEKARSEYNKCINVLLRNNDEILSDVSDKAEIIDRLRFHYENFNNFANILIEMRGIDSKEDFIRLMEILYCVVHETIIVYTAPTAHFARYFCPLVPLLPTDVPNTHKHNFIV